MIAGKGRIGNVSGNNRKLSANTALVETPTGQDVDCYWKLEQRITKKPLRVAKRASEKGPLTVEEIQEAEECLIRQAQSEEDETKQTARWKLEWDAQKLLWTTRGRMHEALVYLPRHSHITKLIILQQHEHSSHSGIDHVIDLATEELARKKIKWKFIPDYAPWQGGIYERMVGLVKESLRRAVGRRLLEEDELRTVLTEVEAIVNERPLTYVADDSMEYIRPIDFLSPYAQITFRVKEPQEGLAISSHREQLLQQWKTSQKTLNRFWKTWSDMYLNTLRQRTQSEHRHPRSCSARTPRLNEIVLIKEDAPRSVWKLARVLCTVASADHAVRAVKLKLANGRECTRPINLIAPLEVTNDDDPIPDEDDGRRSEP
uniref:DUF5641 domain-containing protein n=1 Tax=Ascaris lumbricoides TaxID=6252 RepID=A0A0M3HFV7_ASCLU